jgi:phage terminase Nu1 subunit (DNA packaging protein)
MSLVILSGGKIFAWVLPPAQEMRLTHTRTSSLHTNFSNPHCGTAMKLNQTEVSDAFGVTSTTVQNWRKAGMPARKVGKQLEFDLPECIAWYLDFKRPEPETPTDNTDWDAFYRKEKALMMQQKRLRDSGELVTVAESERLMVARLVKISEQLKNIPLNWGPYLIGLDDTKATQDKLQVLLNDLMKTLSNLPDPEYETEEIDDDVEDIEDIV